MSMPVPANLKDPQSLIRDQRSSRTVQVDRWDTKAHGEAAWKCAPYREARDELAEVTEDAFSEAEDVWALLDKSTPELIAVESVRDDHRLHHTVNAAIVDDLRYSELHELVMGDPIGSALGVRDLTPALIEFFKRNKKLQDELDKQQQRRDEQIQKLAEAMEAGENGDQEGAEAAQAQADQLGEQIEAAEGELEGRLDAAGMGAQVAIAGAMQKALENAEDTQSLARGWDMNPAELAHEDPDGRMELAKLLQNDRVKQAAKFFGALQNMAQTTTRHRPGIPHEMVGVKMGNDIEALLPEQLVMLDDEDLQWSFLIDFADGVLLQYDVRGEETLGRGGLGVGVDISGSMNGEPLSWALAMCLALFGVAKKEKRPFFACFFNTRVQTVVELKTEEALKQMAQIASLSAGGGTCFTQPLDLLLARLEDHSGDRTQSDVVFLTDDQCAVPKGWLDDYHARMDNIGGKTWGISLGGTATTGPLYDICEGAVWSISDFNPKSTRPVKAIFDGISAYRKKRASK